MNTRSTYAGPPSLKARRIRNSFLRCCLCLLTISSLELAAQEEPSPQPPENPAASAEQTPPQAPPVPGDISDREAIPNAVVAPPSNSPEAIEQTQPSFFVHGEPERASREYYKGEQMSVKIRCEVDAFIYVLYTQSDGKTYVVFPNSGAPVGMIPAKQAVLIPAEKDLFRWTVSAPFGKEKFKIIASKVRIPALEKPEMRRKQASLLPEQQIEQVVNTIKTEIPRDQWTETSFDINTFDGINPQSPYYGKRYGVFFSVPLQFDSMIVSQFNKEFDKKFPVGSQLSIPTIVDGIMMENTLRHAGGLENTWRFPNIRDSNQFFGTQSYRHLIKKQITEDLPKITKAGDTVIIYFSGHGGVFNDPRRPSGKQSFLVPFDRISIYGLIALRMLNQREKLDDFDKSRLELVEKELANNHLEFDPTGEKWKTMSEDEQNRLGESVERVLIESTAITDDTLTIWLQKLSHCRVILLLDACMSGGFAPEQTGGRTKGLVPQFRLNTLNNPVDFQFLKPQLGRLKLIGSENAALATAARSNEISTILPIKTDATIDVAAGTLDEAYREINLSESIEKFFGIGREANTKQRRASLFTYYLVQTILTSPASLDIEQATRQCSVGMQKYFDSEVIREMNQKAKQSGETPIEPHVPVFFDNSRPKALLKP